VATLSFDVWWRDHGAKAGLKGLSKEAKEAAQRQKEFKRDAVLAGLGAAAAIVGFAKSSVQAYTESQTAQAKLQDAFRRFPALADTNIGALQDLNSALALKTRFDDDATSAAEAQLAQYKLTGKQITELIPLVQDYAAKTGQDLGSAAEVAGKAILGNGKALKAIGLNFKDAGSASANFTQLVGGLRTQVGGFAQVEGKSAAGQAAILSNQFGELQEAAGAQLLPVLLQLGHTLLDMVGWVQANQVVVVPLAKTLGVLAVGIIAINKTSAGVKAAGQAWEVLTGSLSKFTAEGGRARKAASSFGSAMMGPWGAALAVGGTLLAVWAAKQAAARERTKELTAALDEQTGAVTDNYRQKAIATLQDRGALDAARSLGIALKDFTDAALGNADAQAKVNGQIAAQRALYDSMNAGGRGPVGFRDNLDRVTSALGDANGELAKDQQAWRNQHDAMGASTTAAGAATSATDALTTSTTTNTKALKANVDKLSEREGLLGRRDAERNYQQAIDDLTKSIKDNGKTLDNNTDKGRNNNAALDNLATAAAAYKAAIEKAGGSTAQANAIQQDAYRRLVAAATAMHMSAGAADRYARAVLGIPKTSSTKVNVDMGASLDKVLGLKTALNGLRSRDLSVNVRIKNQSALADLKAQGLARGGAVGYGVGSGDTELAALTRGEHVLTTSDVAAAGGHAGVMRWRRSLHGYASGGPVGQRFAGAAATGVTNVYTLSAPNYVGSRVELLGALTDLARAGRLEKILERRV